MKTFQLDKCQKLSDFLIMEYLAKEYRSRFIATISKYSGPKDFLYTHVTNRELLAIVTKCQFQKLFPRLSSSIKEAWGIDATEHRTIFRTDDTNRSFQRLFTGK